MTPRAADILRRGGLVAFPTETVYGLGADATSDSAVARIFEVKGRPSTNPLIVHVPDVFFAKRQAAAWPSVADDLAAAFWPGPLTLVLPAAASISKLVTAGGATVGLRVPDHPVALDLLRAFAEIGSGAVAAPSANRSNHVSPTTADHVRAELGQAVDLILDGGPCRVGIESTVLDLSAAAPTILRPGGVSRAAIESVIGPVEMRGGSDEGIAASPGRQLRHYAPTIPAYRYEASDADRVAAAIQSTPGRAVLLPLAASQRNLADITQLPMPNDPAESATILYQSLRTAETLGDVLYIEMPPDAPSWAAVRDRLTRATEALPK